MHSAIANTARSTREAISLVFVGTSAPAHLRDDPNFGPYLMPTVELRRASQQNADTFKLRFSLMSWVLTAWQHRPYVHGSTDFVTFGLTHGNIRHPLVWERGSG